MKKYHRSLLIFSLVFALDIILWSQIIYQEKDEWSFRMLDVGQGDSSLLQFSSGAVILTDAGPSRNATRVLDTISLPVSKYIDLAIITHPELDHYGGFGDILDRYEVGAFIVNGRTPSADSLPWSTLMKKIKDKSIPVITVRRGDQITQSGNSIYIISPDQNFRESGELNDTGIVQFVKTTSTSLLLTADVGFDVEQYLLSSGLPRVDILKVGHHGSKYSSSEDFLRTILPKVAVISVGENRYGHPAPEAVSRLRGIVGENIFDTKRYGTITISLREGSLKIKTDRDDGR